MATAARTLSRVVLRSAPSSLKTTATRSARSNAVRQPILQQGSRWQSSGSEQNNAHSEQPPRPPPSKGGSYFLLGAGVATIAGGIIYTKMSDEMVNKGEKASEAVPCVPKFEDYQKVYDAVAERLQEYDEYDDGSYGPVLLRLGWHASGTYDKETGTGGSNGATMRFAPEGDHGANAGLKAARDFLEPVKAKFSWITYSDLWTLAAACAIQEMQGPKIPWRPGRSDRDVSFCTPDGRLPDGSKTQDHLRGIFYRMGFNDKEIVALSGAHALGRCHTDRSGFDGPWTFSPTTLTNDYYKLLLEEKWSYKKWDGPRQFEDVSTKSLMMLPSDMALIQDKSFRKVVERYAKDNEEFFRDFADVVVRLFELGVPFTSSEESRFRFKSLFD